MVLPCLVAGLGMACATPAQATAFTTPLPIAAIGMLDTACLGGEGTAAKVGTIPAAAASITKSSAILGGSMSALDRIRQEQASLNVPAAQTVTPVANRSVINATCSVSSFIPRIEPRPVVATEASSDEFLLTSRFAIQRTVFTDRWNRVSGAHLATSQVQRLIGETASPDVASLERVNRWVNRNIVHAEDRAFRGTADHWALASETLGAGRGDCEDFAILKYQMLLSLGYRPEDMYLTLARDLARNADHAMLIVKQDGRFYMLDNATEAVLPANASYDYRPTISFNSESAWLHGYTRRETRPAQFAHLSVRATSNPRVIGLSK